MNGSSRLKSQWGRAHRSIIGLSAAQKFIAGTLVVVMIATGAWYTAHTTTRATTGTMEPVLDQAFNDSDLLQITEHLRAKGVACDVRDGKVFVPAHRKMEVLSELIYEQVVTGSTESGFDAMIRNTSVWDAPSKTDKMFNHARERMLAGIIGHFKGVRRATVMIDPTNERHFSSPSVTPSASVDIQTRDSSAGDVNRRQIAGAAATAVTGAISAMTRDRVRITIDGASYNAGGGGGEDSAEMVAADLLDRRQQCEQAYVAKVRQQISFVPDALISVSVDLNVQSQEEEKHLVDPDKVVHVETSVETKTEREDAATASAPSKPEDGVLANAVPELPEKLPTPLAAPSRSDSTTTSYLTKTSETVQKTRTPAGKETVLSASIAVPRSYIVGIYKRSVVTKAAAVAEPDDALLQPIVDKQLTRIRNLVRACLGLKSDGDVTVEVYDDAVNVGTPVAAVVGSTQATVVPQVMALSTLSTLPAVVWSNYNRQVTYGAGALIAVIVLSLLMRRKSSASHRPVAVEVNARTRISRRVASSVAAAAAPVDEAEDDETMQDLLMQVRELASRRPEDAARVISQWMDQD